MGCDKKCQCMSGCAKMMADTVRTIMAEGSKQDLEDYLAKSMAHSWSVGFSAGATQV